MTAGTEHERLSAYLDDALPAAEREEFERLLAGRPDLQELAEAWRRMGAALRGLPDHRLPPGFNERVLAAAERRMLQGSDEPESREAGRWRLQVVGGMFAALAAVVLLILSLPPGERRVARQEPPSSPPPAGEARPQPAAVGELRVDNASAAKSPGDAPQDQAALVPAASRNWQGAVGRGDVPQISRYAFTVVISPKDAGQVNELQRILPPPVAPPAEFPLRDLEQAAGRRMAGTALDTDRLAEHQPVELYVATGTASAIQALLQDLRSAGIPATQQALHPLDLSAEGAAVRGGSRVVDGRIPQADRPAAEPEWFRAQPTLPSRAVARGEENDRAGVDLQYLGTAVVPTGSIASSSGPPDDALKSRTLPKVEPNGEAQQVLIVIQHSAPSE